MDEGQNSKQLFKLNDQATTYQRPTSQELLERNAQRAQNFKPILTFNEMSNLPLEQQIPMPKIFIVGCDDPRINAWDIFGLKKWDAVVATGVAGRIAHQFENLLFLDHFLHFEDIMIVHHTNCSAGIFKNAEIQRTLEERAPGHQRIQLPGFEDLEQSVRDDIELVRSSPLVRKELAYRTTGYIYDIQTGKVNLVN